MNPITASFDMSHICESSKVKFSFYGTHFPGLKTVWIKSPFPFFFVIAADPIFHSQVLALFSVLQAQFMILFVFFLVVELAFYGFSFESLRSVDLWL